MAYYRVYLLNASGRVFDMLAIERETDALATIAATKLVRGGPVEIWSGARKVACLTVKESAPGKARSLKLTKSEEERREDARRRMASYRAEKAIASGRKPGVKGRPKALSR